MARRIHSPSPEAGSSTPRLWKKPRLDLPPLTPDDYRDGVMLAPMVRSGALPTRLFSLKHGANLVWGPETVDKAILHATRVVDPVTGVISYEGKSKAIFTTHHIEKPYLIYQIGSADPELAVQAARTVMQDVAGVDLNCGCPKPFSTHSGMGAALLSNPDLLCSILTALRAALPPEISVSAKIRLLPKQEDTKKLVERIVNTGISCLTVHCRTRNMRKTEKAVPERLREIVDYVRGLGKDVAVIENGDCLSWEDAKRVRDITGADSVMIATAAESNPSVFSPTPLTDLSQTLLPPYLRVCKYLDNHWSNTKFCAVQFSGPNILLTRAQTKEITARLSTSKGYDSVEDMVGSWTGEEDFAEIVSAIEARRGRRPPHQLLLDSQPQPQPPQPQSQPAATAEEDEATGPAPEASENDEKENSSSNSAASDSPSAHSHSHYSAFKTPPTSTTGPPDSALLRAPLSAVNDMRVPIPAFISGKEDGTPTPTPGPREVSP
ncbi:hypothetical protein EIP91_011823 [Steccherinum ochraceum]|uniref:DUS-like FMN-binding domain-containing protein n=1 Tax=Steccherinum ochraceum TaxID=92696 RepID=A0A4R0RR41_9APHY|nr:hypothetical protein EIP91_011823 [Steccherinum ochraceum]